MHIENAATHSVASHPNRPRRGQIDVIPMMAAFKIHSWPDAIDRAHMQQRMHGSAGDLRHEKVRMDKSVYQNGSCITQYPINTLCSRAGLFPLSR